MFTIYIKGISQIDTVSKNLLVSEHLSAISIGVRKFSHIAFNYASV